MGFCIASILDTDLYKLTQQLAICRCFPHEIVQYTFINRNKTIFPDGFDKELQRLVDEFSSLALTKDMKSFLQEKCYYMDPVYLDFLHGYRFDPKEVDIQQHDGDLKIKITGPWYRTVLWETPLMALICELYYDTMKIKGMSREKKKTLNYKKIKEIAQLGVTVAEFGTRRRSSFQNHHEFLIDFIASEKRALSGTSNPHFAMMYDLIPIGTQAHEWPMFHAAKYGYRQANALAMKHWVDVFQGNLGIVLPDTFTTDVFLRSFNTLYAKLFDGGRHDSGHPFTFTDKWVNHYRSLHIDSLSKTIVYSDSINSVEVIKSIHSYAQDKIRDSYGIGTWFTNDCGVTPLNIVIKLTGVLINGTWVDTVKLSDDSMKNTGNPEAVDFCKETLLA